MHSGPLRDTPVTLFEPPRCPVCSGFHFSIRRVKAHMPQLDCFVYYVHASHVLTRAGRGSYGFFLCCGWASFFVTEQLVRLSAKADRLPGRSWPDASMKLLRKALRKLRRCMARKPNPKALAQPSVPINYGEMAGARVFIIPCLLSGLYMHSRRLHAWRCFCTWPASMPLRYLLVEF